MSFRGLSEEEALLYAPDGLALLEGLKADPSRVGALTGAEGRGERELNLFAASIVDPARVKYLVSELPTKYQAAVRAFIPKASAQKQGPAPRADQGIITGEDGRPYLIKVTSKDSVYVATRKGGYIQADKDSAASFLRTNWPELVVSIEGEKSSRMMSYAQVFDAYGCNARQIYYSYNGECRFEPTENDRIGDLYIGIGIGAAPPEPVYHEEVMEWLTLSFGDRILDWLSVLPILDRPTAALMLLGAPSIGKSMIAFAAARYFGSAVSGYDDVFKDRFNDALLRGPVVFLDEKTEVRAKSSVFRSLIGNSAHPVEGKGTPTCTLYGCPRLIICTNGDDPLLLGREELGRYDDDAIGSRILQIRCDPRGREWLESRGGRAFTRDWVSVGDSGAGPAGKLPEMISWLFQNRAPSIVLGKRFLIDGDSSSWAASIATREGTPASILRAIQNYQDMTSKDREAKFVKEGLSPFKFGIKGYEDYVLVSVGGLRRCWTELMAERNVPSDDKVGKALQVLSGQEVPVRININGERSRVYCIPMARLLRDDVEV